MHFVEVVIRQAHPGPGEPSYRSVDEKRRDAEAYQRAERLPWTILVDDLEGTVHQVYGALADPTYLIGTDGRVAFYNMWTSVPRLYDAISGPLEQGGKALWPAGWIVAFTYFRPSWTAGGLSRAVCRKASPT